MILHSLLTTAPQARAWEDGVGRGCGGRPARPTEAGAWRLFRPTTAAEHRGLQCVGFFAAGAAKNLEPMGCCVPQPVYVERSL